MELRLQGNNPKFGAYGYVFFPEGRRAIKVFKSASFTREHRSLVFSSECEAYELASRDACTKTMVPQYFGPATVARITDSHGQDISAQFDLDLAYEMERVMGEDRKLNVICDSERERVHSAFKSAGVHYLEDASAFVDARGKVLRVIDFAVRKHPV